MKSRNQKKLLYETIMLNIAKLVKKALNENKEPYFDNANVDYSQYSDEELAKIAEDMFYYYDPDWENGDWDGSYCDCYTGLWEDEAEGWSFEGTGLFLIGDIYESRVVSWTAPDGRLGSFEID